MFSTLLLISIYNSGDVLYSVIDIHNTGDVLCSITDIHNTKDVLYSHNKKCYDAGEVVLLLDSLEQTMP